MPAPPRPWQTRLGRALALSTLCAGLAMSPAQVSAQTGALKSLTKESSGTERADADAPARESPQQVAERVRKQLLALDEPMKIPPGIALIEASAAQDTRALLRHIYERTLRAYEQLGPALHRRRAAEAREREWRHFDQPPPYSIEMVDNLREAAELAAARLARLEADDPGHAAEQARHRDAARVATAALHAAQEAAELTIEPGERARAIWRRDAARQEVRRSAGWLDLESMLGEVEVHDKASGHAELRLLRRQLSVAEPQMRFTQEDVERARRRAENSVDTITHKLETVTAKLAERERARDQVREQLTQLGSSDGAEGDAIELLTASLDAAEAWVRTLRHEIEMLHGEIAMTDQFVKIWSRRLAAYSASDADERREALSQLEKLHAALGRWLEYLRGPLIESRTAMRAAELRVARASELRHPTLSYDEQLFDATSREVALNQRIVDELTRYHSLLARWIVEIRQRGQHQALGTRIADAWAGVREMGAAIWNSEIFAVEETVVVDGRQVTSSHGVTIGKSIGAIALFLGGYLISLLLVRRLSQRLIQRGTDARMVATVRRWTMAIVAAVLLLFTLNVARIPLTVFAFLGGTLAIAIGFGTQTIFRNLISGVILLLERSVQIGDVVELDGVSGTVTAVDLRSSTVHGFDGTETIVPNSVLLENKFTNWTHNDRRVRRVLRIGVAYGSPAREVADILEECARRHGRILDDPHPFVVFEDFGDNALVFALYVWMELKAESPSPLVVLSDLRFMIDKRMREEGIVISFPQRDVHLDSDSPLRIELVRGKRG